MVEVANYGIARDPVIQIPAQEHIAKYLRLTLQSSRGWCSRARPFSETLDVNASNELHTHAHMHSSEYNVFCPQPCGVFGAEKRSFARHILSDGPREDGLCERGGEAASSLQQVLECLDLQLLSSLNNAD